MKDILQVKFAGRSVCRSMKLRNESEIRVSKGDDKMSELRQNKVPHEMILWLVIIDKR